MRSTYWGCCRARASAARTGSNSTERAVNAASGCGTGGGNVVSDGPPAAFTAFTAPYMANAASAARPRQDADVRSA